MPQTWEINRRFGGYHFINSYHEECKRKCWFPSQTFHLSHLKLNCWWSHHFDVLPTRTWAARGCFHVTPVRDEEEGWRRKEVRQTKRGLCHFRPQPRVDLPRWPQEPTTLHGGMCVCVCVVHDSVGVYAAVNCKHINTNLQNRNGAC